jgi:hypothetical protein
LLLVEPHELGARRIYPHGDVFAFAADVFPECKALVASVDVMIPISDRVLGLQAEAFVC